MNTRIIVAALAAAILTLPGTCSRSAGWKKAAASSGCIPRKYRQFHWMFLLLSALLAGCATDTSPHPDADKNLPMKLGRIQHLEQDGVTVQVSIPTDDEASRYFGVPLSEYGIQPIWMRIENASDVDYWLMPIAVDPDYYSADETARVTGEDLANEDQDENTRVFRANALPFFS